MSLFKAREWWSAAAGSDEVFDGKGICVSNIDTSQRGRDQIIIGSYDGILRIFSATPNPFKADDLMLEVYIKEPILQIECGYFVSGSDAIHIAILHPRKLSVHRVSAVSGSVEHGNHYMLTLMYEHILERTSFCMTYGGFGGVKGKDFICVQSMDGVLTAFEQETFSFGTFLPNFLLPGPLTYIPSTDCFVTCSSKRCIEFYKYQTLAVASENEQNGESKPGKLRSGKKLTPDLITNIGEYAIAIQHVALKDNSSCIAVLGEHSLFCIKDNGTIRFSKKLDYNPSCFLAYPSGVEDKLNILVGTFTQSLLIYQDVTLIWAAQLPHVASRCLRGSFQDLQGVTVTLDEYGHLYCSYLGTDPSLFVAPAIDSRDINYDQLDQEMAHLQALIKASQSGDELATMVDTRDEILLSVAVSPHLDKIPYTKDDGMDNEEAEQFPSITVKIILQCESSSPIENVDVQCLASYPILCSQPSITLPIIGSKSQTTELTVSFYSVSGALPSSLAGTVSATYKTSSDAPRVTQCRFELPLQLVCFTGPPIKQASSKITIDTNKDPVNLGDLFPDLIEDTVIPIAAMGFQFYGGPTVTLLSSKSSQRYRLQCDYFEGIWLVLKEFLMRMERHFHKEKASAPFKAAFTGPLPMNEYFELIDAHFEHRLNYRNYKHILGERAQQFRAIQKRLLMRFKDKTPAPLMNLDILLDGTYQQLLALGEACEEALKATKLAGSSLSAGSRLINLLVKLWTSMSPDEYEILEACLSPIIVESEDQGWEETTDLAVNYLLRTCLAKSAKDRTGAHDIKTMDDTIKLKKHIAVLFDRLAKGGKLSVGNDKKPAPIKPKRELNPIKKPPGPLNPYPHDLEGTSPLNKTHMFNDGSTQNDQVETAVNRIMSQQESNS